MDRFWWKFVWTLILWRLNFFIYDLKFNFYVIEKFFDFFTLRPSDLNTTLTYVLMDNLSLFYSIIWVISFIFICCIGYTFISLVPNFFIIQQENKVKSFNFIFHIWKQRTWIIDKILSLSISFLSLSLILSLILTLKSFELFPLFMNDLSGFNVR